MFGMPQMDGFGTTGVPADQPGLPSVMNPGGGPQPGQVDPLAEGINICVSALKQLSLQAKQAGDEQFSNELDMIANRIVKRKLGRQKEISQAQQKGMVAVMSQQL